MQITSNYLHENKYDTQLEYDIFAPKNDVADLKIL